MPRKLIITCIVILFLMIYQDVPGSRVFHELLNLAQVIAPEAISEKNGVMQFYKSLDFPY